MDSLVAECFKLLFVTMTIVFFLFVLGVAVRASYISDYREDITQTIQRYGGLTSAAIAKLNSDSAKYYDNSFTVDTAHSNVGDAGYGDTVNYAVNVSVKAPFRVDFLKTTQSTVLFSGVMKGSAVSQVRKSTSGSDVVNTASTIDSNFADNYNANNINVGSADLDSIPVDSTDQFESSDYMSVTPGKYVFATAFFGHDQSTRDHGLQVAYYDSNKHRLNVECIYPHGSSSRSTGDPLGKSRLFLSDRYTGKIPSNVAYIKFGAIVSKQPNGASLLDKDYSVFVTQENSANAVPSYTAMPDVSWAFKPQLSASASSLATAIKNGTDKTSASEAAGTAASGYDQYWALGRIVEPYGYGYSVYVSPLNGSLTNSNLSPLMLGCDTTGNSTALSTASGFTSKFKGTVPLTQYSSDMGSPSAAGLVTGLPTSSDVYVNSNLADKTVLVGALNSSASDFTVLVNPFATARSAGSSSSHTAVGHNLYTDTRNFNDLASWSSGSDSWTKTTDTYRGLAVMQTSQEWGGLSQYIPVKKGDVLTYSAYVRSTRDTGTSIIFWSLFNNRDEGSYKTATTTSSNNANNVTITNSWQRVSVTTTVTSDGYLRPRLERTPGNANTLQIAGIKVEKGSNATPYSNW